jgi:aldehyde dehydrogenase (NAD+)
VQPSALAPAPSALLARLVTDHVDAGAVAVMEGGPETAAAIVDARVDHVFYTGGADGARAIMACAARHPTPVTLELGGKCPAIVERSADVRRAARRIAWGKFVNAGQTCTAPDYVLVDASLEADLLGELRRATDAMYGRDPRRSPDYGRIASEAHVDRLVALLDGHEIVFGGTSDRGARYLAPTMLRDVDLASPVMHEEIFGPILPVVSVAGVDEAIAFVGARPAPLALYLFTGSQAVVDRVLAETTSGGATVNATMLHAGVLELPFGGTGASGFGASHGRAGFDTFSHARSVLVKGRRPEPSVAYPPYARWKERLLRHFTTR